MRVHAILVAFTALLSACEPAVLPEEFSDCSAADGDEISVDGASISGDTLSVDVGHGGGCETHEYSICWPDQTFMESEPVQVNLEIYHDANGDMCDAYFTSTLTFDLTPLKTAWQDAYQQESGTITVHVDGQTVEYTF